VPPAAARAAPLLQALQQVALHLARRPPQPARVASDMAVLVPLARELGAERLALIAEDLSLRADEGQDLALALDQLRHQLHPLILFLQAEVNRGLVRS